MRRPWLILFLTLVVPSAVVAGEPTPMDRILPAGEVSLIAAASAYGAPPGVPGWPPDNLFHYKLYVPDDYYAHPRTYPLMFIAAPQGDADMGPMADRLTRDRWIVAMLVESRNGSILWLPNFVAAYDDVVKRVRVHERMIFCTGLSGAARVCGAYPGLRPGFRGLILQAAGFMKRPDYLTADVVVYGTFGADDFNRREAHRLRVGLPPGTRRLIEVWDGGHAWAPAEVWGRALDWVLARTLLERPYDERLADAYQWYVTNLLAGFDRARGESERRHLNRLAHALPEGWRLTLDATTTRRLQAMNEGASTRVEDPEIRARDAFGEVAALDEASRGDDLWELAARYGKIAEQYGATVHGALAEIRRQSLLREAGAGPR